jgi:hypothetical protein
MVAGGGGAGAVADLPPHTRAVVAALRALQARLDAAVGAARDEANATARAAAGRVTALYAKRRQLLASVGAPPSFWLRVLRATDAGGLSITPRDAAVLQHLVDVRFDVAPPEDKGKGGGSGEDTLHGLLELEFGEGAVQLAAGSRTLKKVGASVRGARGRHASHVHCPCGAPPAPA